MYFSISTHTIPPSSPALLLGFWRNDIPNRPVLSIAKLVISSFRTMADQSCSCVTGPGAEDYHPCYRCSKLAGICILTMGKGKGSRWNPSACDDCLRIGAALADRHATLDGTHLGPLHITGLVNRVSFLLCSALLGFLLG